MRRGRALTCVLMAMLPWCVPIPAAMRLEVRVRAMIPVGRHPRYAVLAKDGRELYVTVEDDRSIWVVRTATNRVIARIALGCKPQGLALVPDGSSSIAACDAGLRVIALGARGVTPVSTGAVERLAVTKDGKVAYLTEGWAGLWRLEVSTRNLSIVDPLPYPNYLALTPDGKFLYVNYQHFGRGGRAGHDAIAKFDARTGKLLRSITGLPNVGGAVAISPDGRTLWANGMDACSSLAYDHLGCPAVPAGVINVIDTAADRLAHSMALIAPLNNELTVSPDGDLVAVCGSGVHFVDSRTFHVLAGVLESDTNALVFSRDGRRAYATLPNQNKVAVLDIVRH